MTIKIELRELIMTPSNKKRSVMKNLIPDQGDWLHLLLHEIENYNNWVDDRNDSLSKKNDETTIFYEPPIRKCYDW